jgi:hypothetical protein
MSLSTMKKVFDGPIAGTGVQVSSPELDKELGAADDIAVQAIVSQASATGTTFTCATQHSGDRINWREHAIAIDNLSVPTGGTIAEVGYDSEVDPPRMGFTRLAFFLAAAAGTPTAYVQLYVSGRVVT